MGANGLSYAFNLKPKFREQPGGTAVTFLHETQQDVFGPRLGLAEIASSFKRQRQDFFDSQ